MNLKNAEKIYNSDLYLKDLKILRDLEKKRKFCKHDIYHFLSLARIAVILYNERGIEISEDIVYTAALLHDIGRIDKYEKGIAHHKASAKRAEKFLSFTDFSDEEKDLIIKLIYNHRKESDDPIFGIFHEADTLSRNCLCCPKREECDWSDKRKNHRLM